MSMYTFGPKLDYLVCILMFAYILHANDGLYVCKLHSDFCKGMHTRTVQDDGSFYHMCANCIFNASIILLTNCIYYMPNDHK